MDELKFYKKEIEEFDDIFNSYLPNLHDINKLKKDLEEKNLCSVFPNLYKFTKKCLESDNLIEDFYSFFEIRIKEELKQYSSVKKQEKKKFFENKKKIKSIKSLKNIKKIIELNNNTFIVIDNSTMCFFFSFNFQLMTRVFIGEINNNILKLKNENILFQQDNCLMNLETKEFKLSKKIILKNESQNYFIELHNNILIISNSEESLIYKKNEENFICFKVINFTGIPFQLNSYSFILINQEQISQYSINSFELMNSMKNQSQNRFPFIYDENILLLYNENGNGIIDIIDRVKFSKINSIEFYYTGSTAHCYKINAICLTKSDTILLALSEKIYLHYESNRFFLVEKQLSKNKNEFDDCSTLVIYSCVSSIFSLINGNIIIGYLSDGLDIYR